MALFRQWWREGFDSWLARHADDAEPLIFLCELGPPDYAITGPDGRELSDRWAEALSLSRWAQDIWREALEAATGGTILP